jgi:hypothetical protein
MTAPQATFDRRVSDALMDALSDTSSLGAVVDFRNANPLLYDILLVRAQDGDSRASVYSGLTKLLEVRERRRRFRLMAHKTYSSLESFKAEWRRPQELYELAGQRPEIIRYLREAAAAASQRYVRAEGAVQGLVCSGVCKGFAVISREAEPSYRSQEIKDQWTTELGEPLIAAIRAAGRTDAWWPGVRDGGKLPSFGQEADVLAADTDGNLLVIEVKPSNTAKGLVWGPAQVRFYAEVFARVLSIDDQARAKLTAMLAQRRKLGLTPTNEIELQDHPSVIPVLIVGSGTVSQEVARRIPILAAALPHPDPGHSLISPTQLWKVDSTCGVEWQGPATEYLG